MDNRSRARFNDLFDTWAQDYDQAVAGVHPEYREVFAGYHRILKTVVDALHLPEGSRVLEIGVGTGNLSAKLLRAGYRVTGVEPSRKMREKAVQKVPGLRVLDGHFLSLPALSKVEAAVSTYAFHHLTDGEKVRALKEIRRLLLPSGQVVFADTAFASEEEKQAMVAEAEQRGFQELEKDLKREFYPLIPDLERIFEEAGFSVSLRRLNRYVWLMEAALKSR
ncbi:putative AdoMet-dependent methyltransferase [Melghirimyces profundicolus]|uniref:Uncharacterized methyltransferase C8P63_11798 n=1 Tax=Melghirimyces profundicolus TaxID=1242148 RepID=A0A2T6BQH9_9BACL|nr:class I SAM-dependent methyltransferase [Melghirimyces profundicolus]PTX58350.1 putative AdoMet-dependent methyltransferase [Melghirimyces profundicolus]